MQNENEILWTAAFLNERFTTMVSPLGWSFVGSLFEQLALRDPLRFMGYPHAGTIPATRLWHGHPYVNAEIFSIFYKPCPDIFLPADAVRYFPNGNVAARQTAPYPRSMFDPRLVLSLAYHLSRDPLTISPLNYLAWQSFTRHHDARLRTLQSQLDTATNAQQVLRVIRAVYQLDSALLHIHRWSLTYADLFYKLLTHFTGDYAQTLMSRVQNKTRQVNEELAGLAHMSPPLSAELLDRIQRGESLSAVEQRTADALALFLERHGHRSFSLDIAQPTFLDDPVQLLGLVVVGSNQSSNALPVPAASANAPFDTSPSLAPLIALARRYSQLREDQRYYWQKGLALARRAFLMLGRDLAARSILAEPNQIFYATHEQVIAYYGMELGPQELQAAVTKRVLEWSEYTAAERVRGADAYPAFLRGDVPLREHKTVLPSVREWRGRGVSAGTARGVVRIVHEPRNLANVGDGEILVAPSTDPAWTPVFARLKGLVMERGGVLSHGAVVAREYHLPAVSAIAHMTRILNDGDWVEVNGTSGIVRRIP